MSCNAQDLINLAYASDKLAKVSERDLLAIGGASTCNSAGKITPPCVTPTTPGTPTVFQSLDTILKIRWTQPANTGSFITSYTVNYGTTAGGPYTNSVTVALGGKQAILNGLSSGTTYYFVVTANSFAGCSSANSAEGNGATTGSPPICNAGVTFANAWSTQVVANGGAAPSQATINAIANFQCGLITDGLDTLMLAWNAIVPDNFIASLTPQLPGTGGRVLWQQNAMTAADLSINGLTGGGGGFTTYMKTGIVPNTVFPSVNNTGMTVYTFSAANTATETSMGCGDAGPTNYYSMYNCLSGLKYYQEAGAAMTDANPFNGYVSGNRTAANAKAWYKANSVTPHALIASSVAAPAAAMTAQDFWIFVFNQNNVAVGRSTSTLSFIAIHQGLTEAQSALFFARIQTLRTALGGGFV